MQTNSCWIGKKLGLCLVLSGFGWFHSFQQHHGGLFSGEAPGSTEAPAPKALTHYSWADEALKKCSNLVHALFSTENRGGRLCLHLRVGWGRTGGQQASKGKKTRPFLPGIEQACYVSFTCLMIRTYMRICILHVQIYRNTCCLSYTVFDTTCIGYDDTIYLLHWGGWSGKGWRCQGAVWAQICWATDKQRLQGWGHEVGGYGWTKLPVGWRNFLDLDERI